MVVAPKGPSYVFSPWEAPDRARRRDVYTGLVPKGLLSLRGILEGSKSQHILGKPAVKVARGAHAQRRQEESSPRVKQQETGKQEGEELPCARGVLKEPDFFFFC